MTEHDKKQMPEKDGVKQPKDQQAQAAEAQADFGAEAEAMLRDIEADGPYPLRSHPDAEELDPSEIAPEQLMDDDEAIEGSAEELNPDEEVDELPESIEIPTEEEPVYYVEPDEEEEADNSRRKRRRLRNTLIFFIVILVILGAVIGVFVWRNSMSPDVKQSDVDALQNPSVGTSTTVFQPISADGVPTFVSYFGMTPEEAAEQSGAQFSLDEAATPTPEAQAAAEAAAAAQAEGTSAAATPASDPAKVVATRGAFLTKGDGEIIANITFGLNNESRILATTVSFDLDTYGVADAQFDELIADETVPASFLKAVGVDAAAVDEAALSTKENPEAVTSRDTSGLEQAEFSGSTNREAAPTAWKLKEVYDHSKGKTIGDNSIIRTLTIELT